MTMVEKVENIDYVFELLPQMKILSRRSGKAARVRLPILRSCPPMQQATLLKHQRRYVYALVEWIIGYVDIGGKKGEWNDGDAKFPFLTNYYIATTTP